MGTGLPRTASSAREEEDNSAWWVRAILDIHKANRAIVCLQRGMIALQYTTHSKMIE